MPNPGVEFLAQPGIFAHFVDHDSLSILFEIVWRES